VVNRGPHRVGEGGGVIAGKGGGQSRELRRWVRKSGCGCAQGRLAAGAGEGGGAGAGEGDSGSIHLGKRRRHKKGNKEKYGGPFYKFGRNL
jgi:hypothetical protein